MKEENNKSDNQQYLFRGDNQIIKDLVSEKRESFKKLDVLYKRSDETHAEIKSLQPKIISFYK